MPTTIDGYYPYRVIMTINSGKWRGEYSERDICALFTNKNEVKEHLLLVKKFNKNWIRIKVFEKGELIKEWQKENIGISTQ